LLADGLQKEWGQPVIVEAKPGAAGMIAMQDFLTQPADGYTLLVSVNALVTEIPHVIKVRFDPFKDVKPLADLARSGLVFVANASLPAKNVPELVAYAKANPGKVTYASTGLGSTNQLGAEFLAAEAGGLKLTHVPYRGGAPAIADVAAGNVDLFFANVSEIMGMARGGKVRVLALASSRPTALAPELPLLTKDIPALDINNWFGLVGPAGLPADIKDSLAKLFLAAMADPANKETLDKQGLIALGQGPQAFAAYIKQDRERWAKVVKQGNIKAE
jgi:tripartite-type tricarboxylate transporter receptor subunit TctC